MTSSAATAQDRERKKLLDRLMRSEGRSAVSRAVDELLAAGFSLPEEQEIHVKLLEHVDEARATEAIATLGRLLDDEEPRQPLVLERRLRRLEEHAEDAELRAQAAELRHRLRP
ncbi:MAG: hypothetical protein FJ104_02360 [Deltaproteobacteria bacterium]|nr:hypothetical protein [Deltaproteobacteria bacterium]